MYVPYACNVCLRVCVCVYRSIPLYAYKENVCKSAFLKKKKVKKLLLDD